MFCRAAGKSKSPSKAGKHCSAADTTGAAEKIRRLQFPVEQDFWSIVRGILFGRSALDESRDFYASGQTGLSANQTKAYEQIVDMGADPETVYQAIQRWRTAENDEDLNSYGRGVAKRDAITEADLTDEQKLALYRGLSDADSSTPWTTSGR